MLAYDKNTQIDFYAVSFQSVSVGIYLRVAIATDDVMCYSPSRSQCE